MTVEFRDFYGQDTITVTDSDTRMDIRQNKYRKNEFLLELQHIYEGSYLRIGIERDDIPELVEKLLCLYNMKEEES